MGCNMRKGKRGEGRASFKELSRTVKDLKCRIEDQQNVLENQKKSLEVFSDNIDAINASHSLHIASLSGFVGHDIKNCIQSMDAVLSSNTASEITDGNLESLRRQVQLIRDAISSFSELTPGRNTHKFKVSTLVRTVEALTRDLLKENEVSFEKSLPDDFELFTNYPYYVLLQIIHNWIINANRNLVDRLSKGILLRVQVDQELGFISYSVYDTGSLIDDAENVDIFSFGYSTTNGSGIGLYHVKYICDLYDGEVLYCTSDIPLYTKRFVFRLPFSEIGEADD